MEKKTILIIDDEQINLDFFEVMLSRLGFRILQTTSGEEGLELIKEHTPDLIILDNIMPRLTGWELTKMLKRDEAYKKYRDIPVIMFSAMDAVKDKIEGFDLGIDDYITKPFNFLEVLARIKTVLRNHELSKQVALREKRLMQADSLNISLMQYIDHLQTPLNKLYASAKYLRVSDRQVVETFKNQVLDETRHLLATLDSLEGEIKTLQESEGSVREAELALNELEDRFREHFKSLHNEEIRTYDQ